MVHIFSYKNKETAIVIRKNYTNDGIKFFTKENLPQQIGYMKHGKGYIAVPHLHNSIDRKVSLTQETLIIRKGKLRLDLYSSNAKYIESTILNEGDVAILISGGHGLVFLEEAEVIEIKQGPYLGKNDKIRINNVNDKEVKINA